MRGKKSISSIYRFIDTKNFRLIFFAFIVGLTVGLITSFFRLILEQIEQIKAYWYLVPEGSSFLTWLWTILFAIIGVTISLYLIKTFAKEASGSGINEIEGALDGIRPIRWHRVLPVKFLASIFSLGSGLLLGREGPSIQMGGNVGKMIKDVFKQPHTTNNTLVSSGAAAGLAGAFNAPLSGVVFVLEEMHEQFQFNFYSVAAIMTGAGTADIVARLLINSNPIINMDIFTFNNIQYIWLFIVLGIVLAFIGLIYNKLLIFSLNQFGKLKKYPLYFTGAFVGLIIAIVGIFNTDMIGGGYDTIGKALNNSFSIYFLLALFLVRVFLSVFSYGSGVAGGIFLPMLTLGVVLGVLFGNIVALIYPSVITPGVFAVAGMAGIFASIVRAPLTGVILAVEMTSNFDLILPLIITTIVASVFTAMLGNQPIYTTLLKRTVDKKVDKLKLNQ